MVIYNTNESSISTTEWWNVYFNILDHGLDFFNQSTRFFLEDNVRSLM